jgi:hypothetical protein
MFLMGGMPLAVPGAPLAYLDPGAGSLVLQMVLAALFAVGVFVRLFWKKIKGLFGRGRTGESEVQTSSEADDDE